jgi:uncharacterized protein YprB with RNaseH-like and TPR domain
MKKAYLDIETTGLSPVSSYITVVGIMTEEEGKCSKYQLYGDQITYDAIDNIMHQVDVLYTFNGARFDLPFIKQSVGNNLLIGRKHIDLMYSCRKRGLKGGLKSIEKMLGISRDVEGGNGYMAVRLWWQYINYYDENALDKLLRYNMDDVYNLKVLDEKLRAMDDVDSI